MRKPVKFYTSILNLLDDDNTLFLEVGPAPVLSGMGKQCDLDNKATWLASLKRNQNDWNVLLDTLGTLYKVGVRIDFEAFDKHYERFRVPLANYPFERRRYWLSTDNRCHAGLSQQSHDAQSFHPCQGKRIITPYKDKLFEYYCDSGSAFLNDHRIYGSAVVSGSTFISMVASCLKEFESVDALSVLDTVVKEPLYVPETDPRWLQLRLSRNEEGSYNFQVFSVGVEEAEESAPIWKVHADGTAQIIRSLDAEKRRYAFSISDFQTLHNQTRMGEDLYQAVYDSGLRLGRHFKWIDKMWLGEKEVLARMRSAGEGETFPLGQAPSGIIDSCTQLIFSCVPIDDDSAYMFWGYDSFKFYAMEQGKLWCHLQLTNGDESSEIITGKYILFSETGKIVAQSDGAHVKRASKEAFSRSIVGRVEKKTENESQRAPDSLLEELRRMPEERKKDVVTTSLRTQLAKAFWLDSSETVEEDKSLMEMGLDSLIVIELRAFIKSKFGVDVPLSEFLSQPTVSKLTSAICEKFRGEIEIEPQTDELPEIVVDNEHRLEPFPLSDVQYAYWIGRSGELELSDNSCHIYVEVDITDLDDEKFRMAIDRLVDRHEMLRSVVIPDGTQRILPSADSHQLKARKYS